MPDSEPPNDAAQDNKMTAKMTGKTAHSAADADLGKFEILGARYVV
jgi:hypothetical protein